MLQKIQLQTADGAREYKLVLSADALKAAADTGEIAVGEEVVYKQYLVKVLSGEETLILERLAAPGGFSGAMPDVWQFVNIDPAQFMKGGTAN